MPTSTRFNKILTWLLASVVVMAMTWLPATQVFAGALSARFGHTVLAKSDAKPASLVTLANRFIVSQAQLPDFLERWSVIGAYMKQQPDFVSAELKKDILNEREWIMSEQWKSLAAYQQAVSTEAFQALIQDFPAKATWFAQDLFPTR